VIYLYAITEAGADPLASPGLAEAPVRVRGVGGVAALYSEHEQPWLAPDPAALWRHDQVIEAAMERGAVLPVRFGTTFADTDALESALVPQAPRFARQLERVRGCVELAVRVGLPPSVPEVPRGGRDYVELRLKDNRARAQAAERTLVPLNELAVRSWHATEGAETLKASYLVRAHQVDRFAEEVRELQERNDELSLSCTGPWPPYSFVDEGAA
jgi:Gas vesicle synthesis protein GvpL/GvpF